jgi:flagellar hook assembly protein FlgD
VPSDVPEEDLPALAAPLTAYPNPFNPRTTFSFSLEKAAMARITVFSADGRPVRTIADRPFAAGPNTCSWDGRDDRGRGLPSGAYLVRVETASGIRQSKVTLLK